MRSLGVQSFDLSAKFAINPQSTRSASDINSRKVTSQVAVNLSTHCDHLIVNRRVFLLHEEFGRKAQEWESESRGSGVEIAALSGSGERESGQGLGSGWKGVTGLVSDHFRWGSG